MRRWVHNGGVDSLQGQLLVAAPVLTEPTFARTVVLVAEHSEDGAMGVVLNRPTETMVADALPGLVPVIHDDEPVFAGGPVRREGVVVLAEFTVGGQAAASIDDLVGFVRADEDVNRLATTVRRARAFAGHAGWGPGQLDAELEAEGWIVTPHEREDLFADAPETLWARVLERMGGSYALVARMPLDPSVN